MSSHSVLFCGTPSFACPSLQALAEDSAFEVTHVITQPDRPVGRKQELTPSPVKVMAQQFGIPVLQPEDINSLRTPEVRPDFLVVVAYGQIMSSEVLAIPIIAPVNLHASLLPRWRGASPIQHAILEGDDESGVTVQHMAEKLDTGPILSQATVTVDARETSSSLMERLSVLGSKLLIQTLKNPLKETVQKESESLMCGKLTRDMGNVDPEMMTAEAIDRRVRALVPWPGVRTVINGKEVKLIETALEEDDDAFAVECADNTRLYVLRLQTAGKGVVTGADWKRGN